MFTFILPRVMPPSLSSRFFCAQGYSIQGPRWVTMVKLHLSPVGVGPHRSLGFPCLVPLGAVLERIRDSGRNGWK